jgi:transcriptional regulator with XRE-family HTH domain
LQPLETERVKEWRHRRMLSQQEVADHAGTSLFTIQRIERGEGNVRPKTGRSLAAALGVPIEELLPKAQASLFRELAEQEPSEERRTDWSTAVEHAQRLRQTARLRMHKALDAWRASKERGEATAARRGYLDGMGVILQQAYDAETALVNALSGPRIVDQWPELQEADRFYVELWRLVQDAGLSIHTGDGEATAEQEALAEVAQPETRPYSVEEPEAA